MDLAPLTVRDTGFAAHETVRTILTRDRVRVVKVERATASGSFTVRFGLAAVEPCLSLSVRAEGSQGSTARYTRRCRPPDRAQP